MARVISAKSRPKQDHSGDKTPPKPLAEIAASTIPFHPFAAKFPLMKGRDFDELVKDIGTNGLKQPIIKHEGKILDGRNRYRACLKSGVAPIFHVFSGYDPLAYVISANIHRRHLKPKQKRDLIAELIKATPDKSNRQIALVVKVHHSTVGTVREEMESTGEISQLEKTVGADGKSRKTKKSKPKLVADGRPEPKGGKNESIQSPTPVEVESPPIPQPSHVGEAVPAARRHPTVCEAVERLVEVLGAIQFVDAVRELTPDERKALLGRVDSARRYLAQLKEVLTPARAVS